MYTNVVAGSVMLYLQQDFYTIIFKIKHKLYIASGSAPPPPPVKNTGCALKPKSSILFLFAASGWMDGQMNKERNKENV
jgi:hypothetical protein